MSEGMRPGGVTAAAVVAMAGSVCVLGLGLLMFFAAVATNQPAAREAMAQSPAPPISPVTALIVMAVLSLALPVWGGASAIAVLRLKRWGRISFLVFGGVLIAFAVTYALSAALITALPTLTPRPPDVSPRVFVWIAAAMLSFGLVLGGIGTWWLILFNRASVKVQFIDPRAEPPSRPPLPMRIHVIAWMLLCSLVAVPYVLFSGGPVPILLLGYQLSGVTARVALLVLSAANVTAGVGLLRRDPRAYTLAVGVVSLGLINSVALAVQPGGFARLIESSLPPGQPQLFPVELLNSVLTLMMFVSLIAGVALVALLVSARAAYRRACGPPAPLPAG